MRRFLLIAALAVASSVVAVPPAAAQKPVKESSPIHPHEVLTDICAFPVLVQEVVNKTKTITFPNGRVIYSGALKVRLTNQETQKSILVNASGPGVQTPRDDGGIRIKATGHWFWIFPAGELGPGAPAQLLLTVGRVVLTVTGTGEVSLVGGRRTDLCQRLATP